MNIKHKIALIFTGLTAIVLILMGVVIYLFALNYSTDEFFSRLNQRAVISAKANFEKDDVDAKVYKEIRFKYLHTLPEEKEYIYELPIQLSDIKKSSAIPKPFIKRAISQGSASFRDNNLYGTALKYVDDTNNYIIVITARDIHGFNKLFHLRRTIILTILVSLFLVYTLGYFYSLQILKPLNNIINEAKNIKVNNLHRRLEVKKSHKNDELGKLARTYNDMLSRLETSFAIQNRFVNHASHEFKNPLTAILGKIEITLAKNRTKQEYVDTLTSVQQESEKLKNITLNLLQLSRFSNGSNNMTMSPVRIDEVIFDVRSSYIDKIPSNGSINIHFKDIPENPDILRIQGNYYMLRVAISNIVENGIKFSDPVKIDITIAVENKYIVIIITDYGIGIHENDLKSVFETFHRGENARAFPGHGIGLPLTYNVINIHEGFLSVNSVVNQGTSFIIKLPLMA